jgi:hypothetical protein
MDEVQKPSYSDCHTPSPGSQPFTFYSSTSLPCEEPTLSSCVRYECIEDSFSVESVSSSSKYTQDFKLLNGGKRGVALPRVPQLPSATKVNKVWRIIQGCIENRHKGTSQAHRMQQCSLMALRPTMGCSYAMRAAWVTATYICKL